MAKNTKEIFCKTIGLSVKTGKIILLTALILVGIVLSLGIVLFEADNTLPPFATDSELISLFLSKSACFDELLKMAEEDKELLKGQRMCKYGTIYGMPVERTAAYHAIFKEISFWGVGRDSANGNVFFVSSFKYNGDVKGIARLNCRPLHLEQSLDDIPLLGFWHMNDDPKISLRATSFRHLGSNWYIWRESNFSGNY